METELGPQDGIWKPNELQLFKLVRLVVQLIVETQALPTDPEILAIHGLRLHIVKVIFAVHLKIERPGQLWLVHRSFVAFP